MTLAWVHDAEEGELNHLHLIHKIQTSGEYLQQACRYPPYVNQSEHAKMWELAKGGPPRKPTRGSLSLYQGLTRLLGTVFAGRSATEAVVLVAEEVDRQEREDRTQFEGTNGREVRTRAMVPIEALLAIQALLGVSVTVHIPGNTPTRMHHERDEGDEVHLIWFNHCGRGYTDSWMVRRAEQEEDNTSSESESEMDVRDIAWGQQGAEGFWDWEGRKDQIPMDLLTQILHQKQDGQIVTESQGRPLLVSSAQRFTHAQMQEMNLTMREWDEGLMALRGRYWLPPSLIDHILYH
mmetsp:Transcript_59798/g.122695  ORF Transcript_59798/g.122695 Transcript_59798/m.122695 type:complete len:293 (-) Transcript_59798:1005-1883(-)